jgi:hypothetical protein
LGDTSTIHQHAYHHARPVFGGKIGAIDSKAAKAFTYGGTELIAIKAYLTERARGMALETPAIRP